MEISDIKQKAIANSTLSCAFDQEIQTKVTNEIVTNIEKKFTRMHDNIEGQGLSAADKAKFHGRIYALEEAVGESIINAARSAEEEKAKKERESMETTPPPSGISIWIIISIIVIFIIIIIVVVSKKNRDQSYGQYNQSYGQYNQSYGQQPNLSYYQGY